MVKQSDCGGGSLECHHGTGDRGRQFDSKQYEFQLLADASGGKLVWDARDFLAVQIPEPKDGDTWGNWRFEKRTLTLQYRNAEASTDEIDLEGMKSNLGLLIWMKDLSGKVYVTA